MSAFKKGDRVNPVNPQSGNVRADVGTVVRITRQTSMPLYFVRWDDESDDDPLVWFREYEIRKVVPDA